MRAPRRRIRAGGYDAAQVLPGRGRAELRGQKLPQLGRASTVVQVPDADSAEVAVVHEVVLVPERDGVIPVELASAVQRRVDPCVPALIAGWVVGVAVRYIAARLHPGGRRLANSVEVHVRRDMPARD